MGGDFEGETADGLCEWANGLGLCEFEILERYGNRYVAACGDRVEITMLTGGRFADCVTGRAGNAIVYYNAQDDRKGNCSGWGRAHDSRDELAAAIERDAKRLGLYSGQMRLF